MTIEHLRDELVRRGVRLQLDGGCLKWRAPKGAVADLLPDLQRFKVALLEELLESERLHECSWSERPATDRTISMGTVEICRVLQEFTSLFASVRAGKLPCGEDTAYAVRELEVCWSNRARECKRDGRCLTPEEVLSLETARKWLKWLDTARLIGSKAQRNVLSERLPQDTGGSDIALSFDLSNGTSRSRSKY